MRKKKTMKIYVASSWRHPFQPQLVLMLRNAGYEVYDFREPAQTGESSNGLRGKGFSWKQCNPNVPVTAWPPSLLRETLEHPRAVEGFHSDRDAIHWCDVLVMLPGQTAGRSMHLELGYACGLGKRTVVLLLEPCEPELMYKLADAICVNTNELGSYLHKHSTACYPGAAIVPECGFRVLL